MRHPDGLSGLERVTTEHWRPPRVEPLGGWLLRAGTGWTGRANSALALGEPDDARARLDQVMHWYTALGLTPQLACPIPLGPIPMGPIPLGIEFREARTQRQVATVVAAAGWVSEEESSAYVLTATTSSLIEGPDRLPAGLRLDLADRPDEAWLSCYRYRGGPLPPDAVELLLSAPRQVFVSVRDRDGKTAAVARGSLAAGWAGVTAVEVDPGFRRQGLASVTLTAIARWAHTHGSSGVFLQTAVGNAGAQKLYLGAGFAVHHRYDYWVPGPDHQVEDAGSRRSTNGRG